MLKGGNSHLAVFDLHDRRYIAQPYLAEVIGPDQSDDSIPHAFAISPDGHTVYVGMFQSQQGILVVDLDSYDILRAIRIPLSRAHQGVHGWADPLALAIYGDLLLSVNRNNYELAVFSRRDDTLLDTAALGGSQNGPNVITVLGDRAFVGHAEFQGLMLIDLLEVATAVRSTQADAPIGGDPQEVSPEEIEEFRILTTVQSPSLDEWAPVMRETSEQQVKEAIVAHLGNHARKDWGGETCDHYTGSLHVHGKRLTGAFLFKGPSDFRQMTMDMLGKRANQIPRLAGTQAGILIVQHAHEIGPDVREELRVWARQGPYPKYYCFIDGKDTYRLLKALRRL